MNKNNLIVHTFIYFFPSFILKTHSWRIMTAIKYIASRLKLNVLDVVDSTKVHSHQNRKENHLY